MSQPQRRPKTADHHSTPAEAFASSLPTLQQAQLPTKSPYADDERLRRELNFLRKRNKELEADIKKLAPALLKHREMQKAYGQQEVANEERLEVRRTLELEHEQARQQWQGELQRVRANCNKRIATLERQHEHALARANDDISALRAQYEVDKGAEAEREREKRIEMFGRQVLRRILNQGISQAWTAWTEMWEAKIYAMQRLRQAANRLRLPAIAQAFGAFVEEVERAKMRAEAKARRQLEAGLKDGSSQLAEEIKQLKVEYEAKLAAAEEDKRMALQVQLVELTGSSAEKQALVEQQEKEMRVEMLRRQIARRIMNSGISRGWTAWLELWEAKTYAMQRLREVGGRLRTPELAAAFGNWKEEVAEAKRQAELEELEKQSRSLESQLRQAKFEAGQNQLVVVAREDEVKALQQKVRDLQEAAQDKEGHDMRAVVAELRSEMTGLREETEAAVTAEELAEQRLQAAEADLVAQRQGSHKLLQQLLAEQRQRFEEETASMKRQLTEKNAKQAREERVEMLRRMTSKRMMNQGLMRGLSAWIELWEAKTYAMQRLKQVAQRLRSPELADAFQGWLLHWHALKAAALASDAETKAGLLNQQGSTMQALQTELEKVKSELVKTSTEAKQLRVKVAQLEGGVDEAEQRRLELEQQAKEERIELLRRQVGRRMMNQGLSNAWTAWTDLVESKAYTMGVLQRVANRLHAPEKSHAFSHWLRDWQQVMKQKQLAALRQRENALEGSAAQLEQELRQLRNEYEEKLKVEAEKRATLVARLAEVSGGEASMQALLEAQAEQAKEERIALLRRQVGRRMMNQGITNAWTAWFDMWEAKTYTMQTLRQVANRLHAPEKSNAFSHWWKDWQAAKEAALELDARKKASLLNKQGTAVETLQAELEQMKAELAKATGQLKNRPRESGNSAEELERIREEMEAQAKEERIELLRRQVGRRMMNKDLSTAWTAWLEMWEAKMYTMAQLRQVANRLHAPEKSNAFHHWLVDWQEDLRQKKLAAMRQRETALEGSAAQLEEELRTVRAEYEEKLRKAEEAKHIALERQLVQFSGSAEEREAIRQAQEREERIELLRRQVGRRMMNRGLSVGWSAWLEMWEARSYMKQRLRQAGNRFREPNMSKAFSLWVDMWEATVKAKELAELRDKSSSLDAQLNQAKFEAGQLALIKVKHEDEIKELNYKVRAQNEELTIKRNLLQNLSDTRKKNAELSDLSSSNSEAAETAAARLAALEAAVAQQREDDQRLLQSLLDEQREKFEVSVKADREKALKADAAQKQMQDEYDKERSEAKKQEKELRDENSKLKKELDKLKKQLEKKKPPEKPPPNSRALGNIDLDEGPDAKPVSEQIAAALRKNSARVLDLFRDWDVDGDGEVSLQEFRRAMPALGLVVPQADIDSLFKSWDKDGGGALNLRELQKILRAPPSSSKDAGANKDIAPPSTAGAGKGVLAAMKLAKAF